MDIGFTKRHTVVVDVTAVIARGWLERNDPHNRLVSHNKVEEYARDMAAGRWGETHQGIAFDSDGKLFDGQHRLYAVVKSGATVRMRVDCGMPPETRRYVDQGKNRQLPVMLGWMGIFGDHPHHGVNTIAGTVRKMMTGFTAAKGHTTRAEEMEFADRHAEALRFAFGAVSRKANRIAMAPVLAGVARGYYHIERERLLAFGSALSTGIMDGGTDATVIALREWLLKFRGNSNVGHIIYRKTTRAIRAYSDGEVLSKIYEAPEELFPLPALTVGTTQRADPLPWVIGQRGA